MTITKRILSMLLCVVMVLSMLPVTALPASAAEETTYVLAASDFQPKNGYTEGVSTVNSILNQITPNYATMDGFLFCGDYDVNYASSATGKQQLQNTVKSAYPGISHEVYGEGNHDDNGDGSWNASGANDAANYGVFLINEDDYMWYNNDETTIKNTAARLKSYLDAKRNTGYTKPIFIVSHLPLHYSMRTRTSGNGDGKYANYIFDVLNEAGNAGLNIIFLFGHNHSNGWDDYLGGAAIYLKKGDKINIAQASTTEYKEETLAFTYMNPGYVGYYTSNSNSDKTLTMSVFTITEDDVTVTRYDANGLHNLKSVGYANQNYTGEPYSPNTTTYGSPQTIALNKEITPAGEEIEVPTEPSTPTNQRTYTRVTSTSELVSGGQYLIIENASTDYFMLPEGKVQNDRTGFNIESTSVAGGDTITGDYAAKEWTLTTSGTGWVLSADGKNAQMTYQSSDRGKLQLSGSGQSVFTIGGSADNFTFSTTVTNSGRSYNYVFDRSSEGLINGYVKTADTEFYIYRLTDEGSAGPTVDAYTNGWVTAIDPVEGTETIPGTTTSTYVYTRVSSIQNGKAYVIVASDSYVAFMNNNGNKGTQTVTSTNSGATITSSTPLTQWTFSSSSSGTIKNGDYYLYNSSSSKSTLSLSKSSSTWTIKADSSNARFSIKAQRYLYYSSGSFTVNNNTKYVRLYEYTRTDVVTTPDIPGTEGTPGVYYKLSGELAYDVDYGASRNDALAAVMDGIAVQEYIADEKPSTSTDGTAIADNESKLTWELDSSYDGVTPGEYAVTISYDGNVLGVAKVVVPEVPAVAITGYTVDPLVATVPQGSSQSKNTGSTLVVFLEDGTYYKVPVTIDMLSKNGQRVSTLEPGVIDGITVSYQGQPVAEGFTLTVTEKALNHYPEYPNEGAVKVNKTATGVDFQSTGVAQVELSASGVPMENGVDVVVVIDTSSSMNDDGNPKRIQILSDSLKKMLQTFQAPNDNGAVPDVDISIIDFNGYLKAENQYETFDKINLFGTSTSNYRENVDQGRLHTRVNGNSVTTVTIQNTTLTAADFVDVADLDATAIAGNFTATNCKSGTNYDIALQNAYDLLAAKKEANGEEVREQFVIFMSDGAPFRYNGFNNKGGANYNDWNKWLTGEWENADAIRAAGFTNAEYLEFYNGNGTTHPHRYAEAIKGSTEEYYSVIRRDAEGYMTEVPGLGATVYSIGFRLAADTHTGGAVTKDTEAELINVISSGEGYSFPDVQTATELDNAFNHIATSITYAASNARFVDQMGESFNMQFAPITDVHGNAVTDSTGKQIKPTIEIRSYDIYTRAEHDKNPDAVPLNMIGVRKGTYSVLETVTFETDANGVLTAAYSNKKEGNILEGGVINALTFLYNTNPTAVSLDGVDIPTGGDSTLLPSETFYWKMGTVQSTELAMSYYVYLTGSMEGTREAGSYATNEYASLYYTNYLDKDNCVQSPPSPTVAWKSANVSYAFYLVNEQGQIIVNQTTGATGSFANKIAVTQPVLYSEVYLNASEEIPALEVKAIQDDVLPKYYTLYDEDAVYQVKIYSDATGNWTITCGQPVQSTYVTQFNLSDSAAFSNELYTNSLGNDYTHTVVWFAVVWKVQANPDSVVIDYGLPVDIDVMANDMFGEPGTLAAVGPYTEALDTVTGSSTLAEGFGDSYPGQFGNILLDRAKGKLRYTPTTMAMNGVDKFTYAVDYESDVNGGYYYDHLTVIPATTVYYEETFLQLGGSGTAWEDTTENYDASGYVQDEDRPGAYSLTDANNIYGYDGNYAYFASFSLDNAKKVHVGADSYATATFQFIGTGFDVISMTSNTTGLLAVQVQDAQGNTVEARVVNTYYGYIYEARDVIYTLRLNEQGQRQWVLSEILETTSATLTTLPDVNGEGLKINDTIIVHENVWVPTPEQANAMYQVPVMKTKGLPYGKYTVTIIATYTPVFDQTTDDGYDLYLDAIRIYDPAGTQYGTDDAADGITGNLIDESAQNAYLVDKEAYPVYYELRNLILGANSFNGAATELEGAVFIDGKPGGDAEISEYQSYGPNNEVYLAPGQSVAFRLTVNSNVASVHMAVSSADGKKAFATLANIAAQDIEGTGVEAGDYYNTKTREFNTASDMYYNITGWKDDIIVITNTGTEGSGVLSVTNIKITYTEESSSRALFRMSASAAALTVRALSKGVPQENTAVGSPLVTVQPEPYCITKHPQSVTTYPGTAVSFHVETQDPNATYQWQYSKLTKWYNTELTGCTTDTLTVTAGGARDGYKYRCIVTLADGTKLTSDWALLAVETELKITTQPKDQVVAAGDKAQFTAAAEGESLKYQWQYCRPGSGKWIDTAMEGCTKPTVLIAATDARNGYLYRCRITNAAGVTEYTQAATLRILTLEEQPQDATAVVGGNAYFTAAANVTEGIKYQWQYSRDGENWHNTTMEGYNTDTLTVTVTAARNGYRYRCVIIGSKNSQIISQVATLLVNTNEA
ncbi:MAG: VWA domain-containing protein [Oscillospiraceae bacterium]|nr:VWA domain-containing protein [Oscillospiraceae bacterium]